MSRAMFYPADEAEALAGDPDVLLVRVPLSAGKEELLRNLADALQFPGWFGMNWDALYDCLRDLGWIPQRRIILVHPPLSPGMPEADLRTYLEVLRHTIEDWERRRPRRELGAAFEPADVVLVEELGFRRGDPREHVRPEPRERPDLHPVIEPDAARTWFNVLRGAPVNRSGLDPELPSTRFPPAAALLLTSDGRSFVLTRFARDGSVAGDTWSACWDEVQEELDEEFSGVLGEWRQVPAGTEDVQGYVIGQMLAASAG